jgi:hypothetical protein
LVEATPLFGATPARTLPTAVEAEQALLGSLLSNNPRTAERCTFFLRPEALRRPGQWHDLQALNGAHCRRSHCRSRRDTFLRLKLIEVSEEMANAAYGEDIDQDARIMLDNACEAVLALGDRLATTAIGCSCAGGGGGQGERPGMRASIPAPRLQAGPVAFAYRPSCCNSSSISPRGANTGRWADPPLMRKAGVVAFWADRTGNAHQSQNIEAERQACEIRMRATRRLGQLLAKRGKPKGSLGNQYTGPVARADGSKTLADLGISRDQSWRYQKLGEVPEDKFEAALAAPSRVTTGGIIAAQEPPTANGKPSKEPANRQRDGTTVATEGATDGQRKSVGNASAEARKAKQKVTVCPFC